jgi:tripartite-type tricarboxylate transporter receptor subunit TctC
MHWLGGWGEAVNTITLRKPAPANTLKEATEHEVILGTIGKSSNTYLIPAMMNELLGTKFKLISGYRGGSPIRLAIEKGELNGWTGQWLGWKLRKSDWIRDKKIVTLVQLASKKSPDLPDVPLLTEFAKNAEQLHMFKFISSGIADRALATPPGVPEDRLAALAASYAKMLRDPKFLADANKQHYTIDPITRSALQQAIDETASTPPEFVKKLRAAMGLDSSS